MPKHWRARKRVEKTEEVYNKFGVAPKEERTIDGKVFASKKEAHRFQELTWMERAGKIKNLQTQVKYALTVNDVPICSYVADFVYSEPAENAWLDGWIEIVEDTKGFRTPEYKLKKKLMLALHRVEIRET